jgi:hypothetical protein
MANELQKLILKFPNEKWDWDLVIANPNITLEFVLNNKFPWKIENFSLNPNFNFKIMCDYGYDWNANGIFKNIDYKIIRQHLKKKWFIKYKTPEVISYLNENLSVTWEDIKDYKEFEWDYKAFARTVPENEISRVCDKMFQNFTGCRFCEELMKREDIPLNILKKYDFGYTMIYKNPNFKLPNVEYAELPQYYYDNPTLEWHKVEKSYSYRSDYILQNPAIDLVVLNKVNKAWFGSTLKSMQLFYLSLNPNLTCKFAEDNLNLGWFFSNISKNLFLYDKYAIRNKKAL